MRMRYPFESMIQLITALEKDDDPPSLRAIAQEIGRDRLDLFEEMRKRRVAGYCPMGCGETLYLSMGGTVECSSSSCEHPYAVTKLLGDPETEHLVTFQYFGYNAKHPMRERLGDQLLTCGIGDAVEIFFRNAPIPELAEQVTFRFMRSPIGPGGWSWERMEEKRGEE